MNKQTLIIDIFSFFSCSLASAAACALITVSSRFSRISLQLYLHVERYFYEYFCFCFSTPMFMNKERISKTTSCSTSTQSLLFTIVMILSIDPKSKIVDYLIIHISVPKLLYSWFLIYDIHVEIDNMKRHVLHQVFEHMIWNIFIKQNHSSELWCFQNSSSIIHVIKWTSSHFPPSRFVDINSHKSQPIRGLYCVYYINNWSLLNDFVYIIIIIIIRCLMYSVVCRFY